MPHYLLLISTTKPSELLRDVAIVGHVQDAASCAPSKNMVASLRVVKNYPKAGIYSLSPSLAKEKV
jgi:hypothetical protein